MKCREDMRLREIEELRRQGLETYDDLAEERAILRRRAIEKARRESGKDQWPR